MKTIIFLFAFSPLFLSAQITAIPDSLFENALIDLGLDDVFDGGVLTENIDTVRSLNFIFKGIYDMTGIQDFTALEELVLFENYLTELDLTGNPALIFLNCERNTIATIDVTGNPNLEQLRAEQNNLTAIDLSGNPVLFKLTLNANYVSELDFSANPDLKYLYCSNNNLTSFDISPCPNLLEMTCSGNEISTLDFTNNLELRTVFCSQNNLVTLDLSAQIHLDGLFCGYNNLEFINLKNGNNTLIIAGHLAANNNPNLFCIQVDDETYSNDNWTIGVDDHTEFSEFCGVGIEEAVVSQISVYPNPTNGMLFIESNAVKNYQLLNVQGQVLFSGQLIIGNNNLALAHLSEGVYFLEVGDNLQSAIRKIILQNK